MLSLVVLGAMIPLLLDTTVGLLTTRPAPGHSLRWLDYAGNAGMLVGGMMAMVIAYRAARYSKLPSPIAIIVMMGIMVGTIVLSHLS